MRGPHNAKDREKLLEQHKLAQITMEKLQAAVEKECGSTGDAQAAVRSNLETIFDPAYLGGFIDQVMKGSHRAVSGRPQRSLDEEELVNMLRSRLANRTIVMYLLGATTNFFGIANLVAAVLLTLCRTDDKFREALEMLFIAVFVMVKDDPSSASGTEVQFITGVKQVYLQRLLSDIVQKRTIECNNLLDRMRERCIELTLDRVILQENIMSNIRILNPFDLQAHIIRFALAMMDLHRIEFVPADAMRYKLEQNWLWDRHARMVTLDRHELARDILDNLHKDSLFDGYVAQGSNPVPYYPGRDRTEAFFQAIFQSEALLTTLRCHLDSIEEELPGVVEYISEYAKMVGVKRVLPFLLVVPIAIIGSVLYGVGSYKTTGILPSMILQDPGCEGIYSLRTVFGEKAITAFINEPRHHREVKKLVETVNTILESYTAKERQISAEAISRAFVERISFHLESRQHLRLGSLPKALEIGLNPEEIISSNDLLDDIPWADIDDACARLQEEAGSACWSAKKDADWILTRVVPFLVDDSLLTAAVI
ncbi:hypothetical protein NMY22_g9614 [Coprinellus aureogranulatus]|nr:hypothetical protein NMY22_g9614 [Coprinellus aureogranulatus]